VGVTATLAGLTLTNGSNNFGGGLYNDGILTLTDVVVSDNHANIHGGGIFNDGPLTMTNVTITGNAAAGSGGGPFRF
jgi:hypothetical protein